MLAGGSFFCVNYRTHSLVGKIIFRKYQFAFCVRCVRTEKIKGNRLVKRQKNVYVRQ